jgi:hypothetical protein
MENSQESNTNTTPDVSWLWHMANTEPILTFSEVKSPEQAKELSSATSLGYRLALRDLEELGLIKMDDLDRSPNSSDREKWDSLLG